MIWRPPTALDPTGTINPWHAPAPPHGGPAADSAALHELYRLRQLHQLETSDDRTWGIVGLIGCGSLLLIVPFGIFLGPWIFLLGLKLGILPIGMGYLVMHLRGNAKRIWQDAYTAMYFKLATTSLPLLIADTGHASAADRRSASALGQALAAPVNTGPLDLTTTMLRVAKYDLSAATPQQPAHSVAAFTGPPPMRLPVGSLPELQLDMAGRARFAAIYDFFFHPQEEFHAALAQLHTRPTAPPSR